MDIRNGECLELMKTIPDKSVDLFICDLPYGETDCSWDIKIDMEEFWKEFKRIRKSPRVACIHFCSTKFGYTLIKSWEKGFKMDMVWKKRNKTGGLQSRYRPMRNHEMMYFFYEKAPKYNRDKYHKRIKTYPAKKENGKDEFGNDNIGVTIKECGFASNFEPPNPTSVLEEEKETVYSKNGWEHGKSLGSKEFKENLKKKGLKMGYTPAQPGSVLEEKKDQVNGKACKGKGFGGKEFKENLKKNGLKIGYKPPQPGSVLEDDIENCELDIYDFVENWEDAPMSVFESTKVFIGKRNHQTEKPIDILEFFLKYYTDEDDVVLDPTMGSGSTGVACKKLNRKFIGFELDPKIFETAKKRIEKE